MSQMEILFTLQKDTEAYGKLNVMKCDIAQSVFTAQQTSAYQLSSSDRGHKVIDGLT
jgi:hypothetical protein